MTAQTIIAAIEFLTKYGPALIAIGGEAAHAVKDLIVFIEQWRDHPQLTVGQRADLENLLTSDPSTWGFTPIPASPVPVIPVDGKPAPVVDPTTFEYDTLDKAKAAIKDGYPNVIRRVDGSYSIWPAIGPFPGELVYP